MAEDRKRTLLRALVSLFPPLKWALRINDCICATLSWLLEKICLSLKFILKQIVQVLQSVYSCSRRYLTRNQYKPLRKEYTAPVHNEPIPYQNQLVKRSITYTGGLILGTLLYLFIYYVLIKHHTVTIIAVAFLLLLAYLIVLENSHSIRSILMLCLPIMFTNRGRALVFCSMLAILVSGPIKNSQINVKELHSRLNCCKQYLIIKTDKFVDKNIVQGVVKVEDVIYKLVDNIKEFAEQVKARFHLLLQYAISVERYIVAAIEKLKEIVNICNSHTLDSYNHCRETFNYAYLDCRSKLGSSFNFLCEIVQPLKETCSTIKLPEVLCLIPSTIVKFLDQTIGERLRRYLQIIENEFYVEVDVQHVYSYNGTKSKSTRKIVKEIKFDLEKKFWYIHLIVRVFNLVSLILVVWILVTATLYHMHYLTELEYDNMYIDESLKLIDENRKTLGTDQYDEPFFYDSRDDSISDDTEAQAESQADKQKHLFPMVPSQERKYLKPFSIRMNEAEKHKLYIAGFVWLIITGYITFFVLLDYTLYQLIQLVRTILDEILFKGDLPLVDVSSRSEDQFVRYNRTYLANLRARKLKEPAINLANNYRNGSLSSMYRRMMNSIEKNIPDDVAILDSLETCLPHAKEPNFDDYWSLLYLGIFTFGAVIMEAYALRTRHCVADLYYPVRKRKRAYWLYMKLLEEKPKFENPELLEKDNYGDRLLELGVEAVSAKIKR